MDTSEDDCRINGYLRFGFWKKRKLLFVIHNQDYRIITLQKCGDSIHITKTISEITSDI